MKKTKNKNQFIGLKSVIYALKTVHNCAPGMMLAQVSMQTSFWFFTGFVKDVLFLKLLLDLITNGGTFKEYVLLILLLVAAEIIATGINCFSDYYGSVQWKKFYKNLNDKIFQKAVSVDMECYENPAFYDKYKRATEIISEDHIAMFAWQFSNIIAGSLTGIFLIIYVISIDPKILLILLVSVFVLAFETIKGKLDVKKDKEMTPHKRSKAYVKRTLYLRDYAKDMRTSDIFDVMHERYKTAITKNREIIKKYGWKIAFLETMSGFFGKALPVAVTYVYAVFRYAVKKDLKVSDFSVIMTAMSNLKDVFNDVGEAVSDVRREAEYFNNLRAFMEYESKVIGGTKIAEELECIEFRNVSFTYPDTDEATLNNLNLKINKGETIAIVGKNGAGKSTFVKLLLRFYDVDTGEILYNGVNIKEYDIASLRSKLATVFQDYKVFALSIGENILCKEIETEKDKENVATAIINSGASTCVDKLPQKAETVLTREFDEKGTGISGGEQQKIATARMFAKDFELAILDEPSSALDPVAEYKMYESLIEATVNKTVIYISHRLSSAVLSDNIYVFDNGSVSEHGTHEQLMANKQGYYEMFTLQASSYKSQEEVEM
ncbi:MAG: ABC transporter ATP-binding protein [Clostridia bacterium]|nr:ABC transporter ATP-binding protein [Clostridia bacterium]